MTATPLVVRFEVDDVITADRLNGLADAIDAVQQKQEQPDGVLGVVALGLMAAGSASKRVSRRSFLGLWLRGDR